MDNSTEIVRQATSLNVSTLDIIPSESMPRFKTLEVSIANMTLRHDEEACILK